ncbi:hypothetical protein JK165_02195 [Acetobacter okinawensis]|uniref:hypothetical protein n=1 Tax=Acetobacter okinawensis TaxID=1076594 RepID=UPI001BA51255|nr:hypothetical protein [Acetobacter okinawensis]MBS0964916.1 hypothetical protein [Acetobacter okinawensis]
MKQNSPFSLHLLGVVSLCAIAPAETALAAPPAGCATVHASSEEDTPKGLIYHDLSVSAPSGITSLHVKKLVFAGRASSAQATQDLAQAASLLLVSTMTGQHNAACTQWLTEQGKQVVAGLQSGAAYDLTWNSATIEHGAAHVNVATARYQMQGTAGPHTSSASLSMSGLSFHNVANQQLLPSAAQAAFSLPTAEIPALISAVGGRSTAAPAVHATISNFEASEGTVRLQGHGQATLTGDVAATSASGHLEITNLEELIEKARTARQMKLAAGLVLGRLVSHRSGEQNTWDTTWTGGVLTVNGFPLPIK